MAVHGYSNYHGKKNLKQALLIAVQVVLLALSTSYMLSQDYVVYDSQGNATLQLPFVPSSDGGPSDDAAPQDGEGQDGDVSLEIMSPSAAGAVPSGDLEFLRPTEITLEELRTQLTVAPAAGDNALLVELKDETGAFTYESKYATEGAADRRALSRYGMLAMLGSQRWTSIAAIHCFRDTRYAFEHVEDAGLRQLSGSIWADSQNNYWLDPAKAETREYLYAVAGECRDMGFDELLLRDFGYPAQGSLSRIDYGGAEASKEDVLADFLSGLREVLEGETRLAVELTVEQVLAGRDPASGVNLARLVPLMDRLFVTGAEDPSAVAAVVEPLLDGRELSAFLVVAEASAQGV